MKNPNFDMVRHSQNVHSISLKEKVPFLLISDLHWDNPHCDRELLKNHLDEAVRRNAIIVVNGDFFCLMQGKADPRRSKDDIRPEHNNGRYLDSIVETAAEWFAPYAHHIALIGYGNHETSVIKNQETDVLQRFADLINFKCGSNIFVGGYGGVLSISLNQGQTPRNEKKSYVIHYFHGHGGGGVVSKGVLQDHRILASIEGYDCTWQGHVHELYHHINVVHRFDVQNKVIIQRYISQIRTATYKEEWADGIGGFHVERGRPPKPLGGYWLELSSHRYRNPKKGIDRMNIIADFVACSRPY